MDNDENLTLTTLEVSSELTDEGVKSHEPSPSCKPLNVPRSSVEESRRHQWKSPVETPICYNFESIPKSMYLKEPSVPPAVASRGPTSVSEMLKLKNETRERLRQQRWRRQREKCRNDMFTNPDKYITSPRNREEASDEVLFLESFRVAARKPEAAESLSSLPDRSKSRGRSREGEGEGDVSSRSRGNATVSPRKSKSKSKSPGKSARGIKNSTRLSVDFQSTDNSHCDPVNSSSSSPPKNKKQKKFISPYPKPLPALRPKSPPKPRPDVFLLPAQKIPTSAMLASSPRLLAAMTFFQKESVDEFGYSSYSDNDDEEEIDPEHVLLAKQLEREERRLRHEEAEYRNHIKFMETLSTDQV
jgi:hypothetical protein